MLGCLDFLSRTSVGGAYEPDIGVVYLKGVIMEARAPKRSPIA